MIISVYRLILWWFFTCTSWCSVWRKRAMADVDWPDGRRSNNHEYWSIGRPSCLRHFVMVASFLLYFIHTLGVYWLRIINSVRIMVSWLKYLVVFNREKFILWKVTAQICLSAWPLILFFTTYYYFGGIILHLGWPRTRQPGET